MTDPKLILLFDLDGTLIDSAPDLVENDEHYPAASWAHHATDRCREEISR